MIKLINRVRHTCLWFIIFFGVLFTGWFLVTTTAMAGDWNTFIQYQDGMTMGGWLASLGDSGGC